MKNGPRTILLTLTLAAPSACGVAPGRGGAAENSGGASLAAPASSAPEVIAANANNIFAISLLQELVGDKCQCVSDQLFAPQSITSSLAMLAAGAGGATATEMTATLGFADGVAAMNAGASALSASLQGFGLPGPEIYSANRVWLKANMPVAASYLDTLKTSYGADTGVIPEQADAARQSINTWVDYHTQGQIPQLLPAGTDVSSADLLLTNALDLKARWAHPFDSQLTTMASFTTAHGEKTVRMMHQGRPLRYGETANFRLLELPYSGDRLVMDIASPVSDASWEDADLGYNIETAIASTGRRWVDASIPVFSMRASTHLGGELQRLGMTTPFTDAADFSAITGQTTGLKLQEVIHEAVIDVTERGTEAGASTASVIVTTSLDPSPVDFRADHPFLFLIRDSQTGAYLFVGIYQGQ